MRRLDQNKFTQLIRRVLNSTLSCRTNSATDRFLPGSGVYLQTFIYIPAMTQSFYSRCLMLSCLGSQPIISGMWVLFVPPEPTAVAVWFPERVCALVTVWC